MQRIILIVIFLFIFFINISYATPASDLTQHLNAVRTMQADFSQMIYDNRGKPIQASIGKMALQRPGQFRWETQKPLPQLIIANGSRLWIYDPDLEQVTVRLLNAEAGDTPALLLSHANLILDKEYTVKTLNKPLSPLQWFVLVPKKKDSMFASIQLGFLRDQIKEMQLQDHLGHTTFIQFKNIKINVSFSNKLFVFKVPRGVDVIDETKKDS